MSYILTQTQLGADNIQLDVLWSVNAQQYILQSNLQFTQLLRTIFDVADSIVNTTIPDYRLLRPTPATSGTSKNVAAGENALVSLAGGSENVAVGYQAMIGATTTCRNVVIGATAGFALTTAPSSNAGGSVLIGWAAGIAITTGTNNIAIGRNANSVTILGDNNLSVGRDSAPLSSNLNNTIAIGRGAIAGAGGDGEIAIGSATYPILLAATAGGSSGQHLVLRLNGTQYKVALLNA